MLDDTTHQAAIRDLRRLHPDHPAAAVAMVDGHILAGEYEQALQAVATVRQHTLDDPYLNVLESMVLLFAGRHTEAKEAAQVAVTAEPGLEDAHWALVSAALKEGDYATVTRGLVHLRDAFSVNIDLEGAEDYAAYRASSEYSRWLEASKE